MLFFYDEPKYCVIDYQMLVIFYIAGTPTTSRGSISGLWASHRNILEDAERHSRFTDVTNDPTTSDSCRNTSSISNPLTNGSNTFKSSVGSYSSGDSDASRSRDSNVNDIAPEDRSSTTRLSRRSTPHMNSIDSNGKSGFLQQRTISIGSGGGGLIKPKTANDAHNNADDNM